MIKLALALMVLGLATQSRIPAQPPSQPPPGTAASPEFEVASVKPIKRQIGPGAGPWTFTHGRFSAEAATLRGVIGWAYGALTIQVHGGPDWLDTERYDFAAKAESSDAGRDQLKLMLQALLADRFKLVVHRETKNLPVYSLVVAKNGPKLQEAKDTEQTYGTWIGRDKVVCTKLNMRGLVDLLTGVLGSPVDDKTGLTARYDFKLEWTSPRPLRRVKSDSQPLDSAPDIFGALQEQLGLKLEAKKGPVEILSSIAPKKPPKTKASSDHDAVAAEHPLYGRERRHRSCFYERCVVPPKAREAPLFPRAVVVHQVGAVARGRIGHPLIHV